MQDLTLEPAPDLAMSSGDPMETKRQNGLRLLRAPARTASGSRLQGRGLGAAAVRSPRQATWPLAHRDPWLVGLADESECQPLRRHVGELLRRRMDECDTKLAELQAFRASLEKRYRLALEREDDPACGCAAFPARCGCQPVPITQLTATPSAVPLNRRAAQPLPT